MAEATRYKTIEEQLKKQEASQFKIQELLEGLLKSQQALEAKLEASEKKTEEKIASLESQVFSFMKRMIGKNLEGEFSGGSHSVDQNPILPTPTQKHKEERESTLLTERVGDDSRLSTPVQIEEILVKNEDDSGHQVQEVENEFSCNHTAAEEIEQMVFDISPHSERGNNFFEYFEVLDVVRHVNLKDDDGNKQPEFRMEEKKLHFDCCDCVRDHNCDCAGLNNSKCISIRGEENNGNENNIFQFQTVVVLQMETINFQKLCDKPIMLVSDGISDFGKYSFTWELVKTTLEKAKEVCKPWTELFTAFKGGTIWSEGLYDFLSKQVAGLIGEMWKTIQEMVRGSSLISPTDLSELVRILGRSKRVSKALKIFYQVKARKCKLTATTYNSSILMLMQQGHHEASSWFERMKTNGVSLNSFTYSILIDGCCRTNRVEKALILLEKMDEKGFPHCPTAYCSLINSLGKAKRYEAANELFQELRKNCEFLSSRVYAVMIKHFGKCERPAEALDIFNEEQLVEPTIGSCWKSISFLYLLDKRTIRMISGAKLLLSAPKASVDKGDYKNY